MPTVIETDGNFAVEESTYVITVSFKDEDDNLITPDSATWTLSDTSGNIINNREDIVISALASSVDITLSGDDLAIQTGESGNYHNRIFTVEAIYGGLPLKDQLKFPVFNLTVVT